MPRLTRAMETMDRFLASDYPACIKAHYFVSVFVPRIMCEIGLNECAVEMARKFATGLAEHCGYCTMCCKVPSVVDDLCGKCKTEYNELCAEMDADTEPEGTGDKE